MSRAGYIYILSNPAYQGILKIGYTTKTPERRAKELSSATGCVAPFKVEWSRHVPQNARGLEKRVHRALSRHRERKDREFFKITLEEAIERIDHLAEGMLSGRIKVEAIPDNSPTRLTPLEIYQEMKRQGLIKVAASAPSTTSNNPPSEPRYYYPDEEKAKNKRGLFRRIFGK